MYWKISRKLGVGHFDKADSLYVDYLWINGEDEGQGSNFMDIRDLIGEATEYDKKQSLEVKKPKSWLKNVSAFANTFGGKIIFGVRDDDVIIGLENAREDAEIISETIKIA